MKRETRTKLILTIISLSIVGVFLYDLIIYNPFPFSFILKNFGVQCLNLGLVIAILIPGLISIIKNGTLNKKIVSIVVIGAFSVLIIHKTILLLTGTTFAIVLNSFFLTSLKIILILSALLFVKMIKNNKINKTQLYVIISTALVLLILHSLIPLSYAWLKQILFNVIEIILMFAVFLSVMTLIIKQDIKLCLRKKHNQEFIETKTTITKKKCSYCGSEVSKKSKKCDACGSRDFDIVEE